MRRWMRAGAVGGWGWAVLATGLLGVMLSIIPASAAAIELCSLEGRTLMRSVDIDEGKIAALCAKAARAAAPLTLRLVRMQDDLSHCRVTLALTNNSTLTLNALVLTTEQARFQPFHFRAIAPGGTGYASASSRILLACDELTALKLAFHWPVSLRIGDRFPAGKQLQHYRPYLLDPVLAWSDPNGQDRSPGNPP